MRKLLIVEDDKMLGRAYSRSAMSVDDMDTKIVGDCDHAVFEVEGGFLPTHVITDVDTCGSMNGIEFANWMRDYNQETKIIIVSGGSWSESAAQANDHDFLLKPTTFEEIKMRLGLE